MNVLRILPLALALFTSPALVIPSVVEGPGCVAARVLSEQAPVDVEYPEPRVVQESPAVVLVQAATPARVPLRGASTPRAPANVGRAL